MPEEMKPGHDENACTIHVVYMPDSEKEIPGKEFSSTLIFEASMLRGDVLEKVTRQISEKLNEGNVSEFKLECKFPKK